MAGTGGGGGGCGEVNQRNVVVDERSWSRPDDGVRGHGWAAAGLVSDQSREEELAHHALCSICPWAPLAALYRVGNSETSAPRPPVRRWYRDGILRGSSSSLSFSPSTIHVSWDANSG